MQITSSFAYATSWSFSVSSQRRFSSRCSAGSARRSSFSRCDERQQRPVERAALHLVLLGVEVLLGAVRDGRVLERLEAGVDAVGRRERRRQHEPRLERGRAADLQVLVEDVGRVHERVRPVELRPREQLLDVLDELRLRVLPGEVRVALREAELRERRHQRRPREGLREEDHLGMVAAHLRDQPLPERRRLRVRVVDAEDRDPPLHPVQDDVAQRLPEPLPVLRLEVDVVDVLVALRRVLRVLQRSVGAPVEPLRMLLQPRMVRRALDREVERELDAGRARGGDHRVEVVPRAEVGTDRVVAALRRSRSPTGSRRRPARR